MTILLAHPTTAHASHTANELHAANILGKYITSFHYVEGGAIENVLKILPSGLQHALHRKLMRRRRTSVPGELIKTFPYIELANRLYLRFNPQGDKHWGFRMFDRYVATLITDKFSGYFGFLTSALLSLRRSRELGMPGFLDMPICHWNTGRQLLSDESERWGVESDYRDPYPWEAERFNSEMDEELELAELIFVGSDFVRDSLVDNGMSAEKVVVNPYGVDLSLYRPKDPATGFHSQRRNDPKRSFRLISVGKLGLRKGTLDILVAAQQLGTAVEVRLLGANELPPHLQKKFWGPNVEYFGHVPYREVPAMLRWADAYVFPTIFEGSSLASYEAMAAGLPIITTANCGSVVRDGVDGWLVPIRSPDIICTSVTRLMEDETLWYSMSVSAHEQAKKFTWGHYGKMLSSSLLPYLERRE